MFEFRTNPTHPVIYKALHSENTKLAIQIPPRKGMEKDLRAAIGGGHVDFDWNSKLFEMASSHIETVTAYLVERFGACELQIMTSNVELCTTQCQTAKVRPVSECECVCGGHNHGDGWPEGWKLAARSGELLVKGTRKIEIFTVQKPKKNLLDMSTWIPMDEDDPRLLNLD